MKKVVLISTFAISLVTSTAFAHHPAADIVDEEIYSMIDSIVADTPHATLTFDEMGGGMTETSITTETLDTFETLIEDENLLEYQERLSALISDYRLS